MTKLKKMIFNAKQYQFGYNDAMNVAFENERELKALIEELERTNKKHCKAHLMSIDKIDKLQAKVEELTKPVENEKIQSAVKFLRWYIEPKTEYGENRCKDIADLIERFAREKAQLQAKVEELKTAVKDLVGVTQDSFYVRHYLRTHYPALKQEGEL